MMMMTNTTIFYVAITQHMPLQGRLDKKPILCQRYDFSKQCVFSLDLNDSRVDADLMDVGMLFQHRGPATEKARSPKQVFDFRTLDRPSPQITDVLPLSMSTLQRSIILDSLAQHHVETCRRARQVCNRYGTAPEASVDDHGAMTSHGHTFDDCRPALLQNSGLTAACQADTLARPIIVLYSSIYIAPLNSHGQTEA